MTKRNPLDLIPSPEAIRRRLANVKREVKQLTVLLQTAERIQRAGRSKSDRDQTGGDDE